MNLKKLFADLPIEWVCGPKDLAITGISAHSKSVAPGNLFLMKNEASHHALMHLDEALAGGAVAVASCEKVCIVPEGIAQIKVDNIASIELELGRRFFPFDHLPICAITGTNGKTTISFLIKHILEKLDKKVGVIGTIAYIIGDIQLHSALTTPDTLTAYRLLFEMHRHQCDFAVMETSSHGLAQGRTKGLNFVAGIFTNLTQDHLDYHGSLIEYAKAKRLLFESLSEQATAIVNADSAYVDFMLQGCKAKSLRYGCFDADLSAKHIVLSPTHSVFEVSYLKEKGSVSIPLAGRFNVYNTLAAIGFCLVQGFSLEAICQACSSFTGVPGRLEHINNNRGINIFIDFAHTPDALEQVCRTLKECTTKDLIVVFGAGGDRDTSKRELMGRVVDNYATYSYLTSDNPRSESPLEICLQISKGVLSNQYEIEIDRRLAIHKALERAKDGDTVLIAGKGHESYQIIGHQTLPFEDRQVVEELLKGEACLKELLF